ncbi:Transducin beta-like protein 2 [Hordeum vulgare]|nr:Transducin beta-like protein 2 [Hordeum vulgare]
MYGAFKVCVYSFLVFLVLAVLLVCVAYVIALVSGSTSGFKKEAAKKHHHLDLNTLGGHTECITMLDFSSDACNIATGDPLLKAIRGDTLSAAEEKASYFINAEKLKVGYTSRTRIRRATAVEGI